MKKVRISMEESLAYIERAFKPLDCRAKSRDRGQKVQFRVYGDDGNSLLNVLLTKAQFSTKERLTPNLKKCRKRLESRGYELAHFE